jgi:hypothetical protein
MGIIIPGIVAIMLLAIALILVLAGIQTISGVPVLSAGPFSQNKPVTAHFSFPKTFSVFPFSSSAGDH